MRYIQPDEAVRLLETLVRITDVYYNNEVVFDDKDTYIKNLELATHEMAMLAQNQLDGLYDLLELNVIGKGRT